MSNTGWWSRATLPDNGGAMTDPYPYTTSIDAIREAAMERFKDKESGLLFAMALSDEAHYNQQRFAWQLTAIDWAVAFARTSKIWIYKL